MTAVVARAVPLLVVLALPGDAGFAQPASAEWNCTGWRHVQPTMLNPFGRDCVQWSLGTPADLSKMSPPPFASRQSPNQAEAQNPASDAETGASKSREKNRHSR